MASLPPAPAGQLLLIGGHHCLCQSLPTSHDGQQQRQWWQPLGLWSKEMDTQTAKAFRVPERRPLLGPGSRRGYGPQGW